jgi:hypothetical protein
LCAISGTARRKATTSSECAAQYAGVTGQVGGVDLTPIQQSISGIGQTLVGSVSWLIASLAALLPWLPVIAFVWWIARRGIRRWRARKAQSMT